MSSTPPGKRVQKQENKQAIRRVLRTANRDLGQQTIADKAGCSRTTVLRQIKEMNDVVETREIGRRSLYELQDDE